MSLTLPFVGRRKEASQLQRLHGQHKHSLILGPAGVGKTALIADAANRLPLLICPNSVRLTDICSALESQLQLEAHGQRLIPRKSHLLNTLRNAGQTVVFDGVTWTTPKLSSFLECVMERAPVWIARSDHSWDIGRAWPLLGRFTRIEINPFHLAETRELIEAAIKLPAQLCRKGFVRRPRAASTAKLLPTISRRSLMPSNPRCLRPFPCNIRST